MHSELINSRAYMVKTWGQRESGSSQSYSLSPMQSGMVFHALLHGAHGRSGGYDIEQLQLTLREEIDAPRLARAWSHVTQRHTALSSSFVWSQGSAPRQWPNANLEVPLELQDWSALTEAARIERRRAFLAEDRARGFDLQQAPLQRVTVFHLGAGETELVWTFHHLILDGYSIPIVLREVFEQYESASVPSNDHAGAQRPFRDYIEWLEARDSSSALAHFRDLLRNKHSPTPLPCSQSNARARTGEAYGALTHELAPEVLASLGELAQRIDVKLGHIVQVAWAIVLARFTGDRDVVFGAVRECRRNALDGAAGRMVGMLMNVVPIRICISEQQSVRELLTCVSAQNVALRPFELSPLVDVQRESDLPKGSPLIQTLLLFEREELNQRLRREAGVAWLDRSAKLHEQPTWPLNVKVCSSDPFTIEMMFDRTRFRQGAIERLATALAFTLEDLAGDEHRPLRELTAIPPLERQRLVYEWNRTQHPFPRDRLLHELFEQRVDSSPDAIAIELGERTLTYRELEERANRLAYALRARGARPGVYIGICLSRSMDLLVAMLAVSKAGAGYLPLDQRYSDDRLRFMLDVAQASLVLTEGRFLERFSVPALALDRAFAELASQPIARPERRAAPSDVAYAIFTSGSTGAPKGVVMSHRAVLNTLDWVTRTFNVGLGDRLLFVTSPSFDLSVYDVFGALGSGATVVIADDELLGDVEALAAAVFARKITIWNSAPAALERLLPFLPAAAGEPLLRLVMLSGDWLPLSMLPTLRGAFPSARIVNLGGATEAAIWSNWFEVDTVDPAWTSVPYGRPIQNCQYYLLDADFEPVPIGAVGEIHIGGTCVAEGYLDPEQTAERFVSDPFSRELGARLYKTGDLARYFEDGNLELLGRIDSQVKIRGFRVELAEVEAALGKLPEVQQAACAAYVDGSGHKALVAYLVSRQGSQLKAEAVRRALAATLPDFMVPSRVELLPQLPLSSNGKVDRAALKLSQQREEGTSFVPATTATERALVQIWQKVLQHSPIGVDDDFFALGGHSLLAVQIFNEVNRWRGSKFPLATLFECSTIRSLAVRLDEIDCPSKDVETVAPWTTLVPVQPHGSLTPFFCIAGLGGDCMEMRQLAAGLGPDRPFYGMQYRGVDGRRAPHRSIYDLATEFLQDIRRKQPHGPYYLSGFSAGGIAAYEVAQMLIREGESVALLALIDAFSPRLEKWSLTEHWTLKARHFRDRGFRGASARVRFHVVGWARELDQRLRSFWTGEPHFELRHAQVRAGFLAGLARYVPEPYTDNVLLIRSNPARRLGVGTGYRPHESNGWRSLVSGIGVVTIDCDHLDLLESHVSETAGALSAAISASSPAPTNRTEPTPRSAGSGSSVAAPPLEHSSASRPA